MTHGQYENKCRLLKTEDHYYTEEEAHGMVYYLLHKYDLWDVLESRNWFDYQIEVANMLGIEYGDLYLKDINIENLFRAYSIENAKI